MLPTCLPIPRSLHVEALLLDDDGLTIVAAVDDETARCPLCGWRADRIHSRYGRTVADLPWATTVVRLHIHVRRFFCDNDACPRKIFGERLDEVTTAHAQRTARLQASLTAIACVALSLPLIRKRGDERFLVACAGVLFAFFMLQTRIHERYFFPAVALMAAVAALRGRWVWLHLAMTGIYLFNVGGVYRWLLLGNHPRILCPRPGGPVPRSGFATPHEIRALVAINLALLAVFGIAALLDLRAPAETPMRE